jgi:hypothetical protein
VYGASKSSNCVSSLLDRTFISAITAVSSQARYKRRNGRSRRRKRRRMRGGAGSEKRQRRRKTDLNISIFTNFHFHHFILIFCLFTISIQYPSTHLCAVLNSSLSLFSPSPTYLDSKISWFTERILTSLTLLIISAMDLINFDFPVPSG